MSLSKYLARKLVGLPAYDSKELMEAKRYRSFLTKGRSSSLGGLYFGSKSRYDLHEKKLDHGTFGAIESVSSTDDMSLSEEELEQKAQAIYDKNSRNFDTY